MNELMGRMKAMEKKLENQQQALSAANNQASSQFNSFQPQNVRGRGRDYNRGYSRSNRGSFGRGYRNNWNEENQNRSSSEGRGGFRGN